MKISIGLNIFKKSHRQDLCIDSLLKLKNKFKGIELYNYQFEDGTDFNEHPELKTIKILKQKSGILVPNSRNPNLPIVNEFFDNLSQTDCDYFIFTNNDIIISDRYIKLLETKHDCYPASRLAIYDIPSIDTPITKYSHYQVAGFDTYAVKKEWWIKNKELFPQYILGMPTWDVHFATIMMLKGKSLLCNKMPPSIFHIIHDSNWMESQEIPERKYNEELFFKKHEKHAYIWNRYLFSVLLKRQNEYREVFKEELELEKEFFREI
jgi:hypothetical protein